MKFKRKIVSFLLGAATIVPLSGTVGAQDGVDWSSLVEGAAYEMSSACRGTVPALTPTGLSLAGSGYINSTFTDCKTLRVDYHAADGTWYPYLLMAEPPFPACIPSLEPPIREGAAAILTFSSWMDNEGCLLENTWYGTTFRIYHPLGSHTEGMISRNWENEVYVLPINMVDGPAAVESWVDISIGN